jgi:predicted helicase
LEEGIKQEDLFSFGFAESITEESKEADKIKKNTPIMVVLGNPPYSVSSSNKGEWIQELIKVYKQDLNEKKINLDDDYIKFIRLAESYIEKNQTGIVAMITNNSFIDGITHRQMRKHLLETFDDIYILNLHGNSKRKKSLQMVLRTRMYLILCRE